MRYAVCGVREVGHVLRRVRMKGKKPSYARIMGLESLLGVRSGDVRLRSDYV